MTRPVHLRLSYLGLAFVGGTLGTAAREAVSLSLPSLGDVPWAILTLNVLGAFALGLLLDSLARSGPDDGWRRRTRILVGTGFMGGFTTYSALAADTAGLLGAGPGGASSPGVGLAYGVGTVLIGGLATFAGIATATALRRGGSEVDEGAADLPIDPDAWDEDAADAGPDVSTNPHPGSAR
ncbi:fluoride efflux transporter FluC [Brevibacterium sp. VCM10]|uniref:fluoride efflux transporter FluC n=1 Tax=Brevibacterium sp. VCM10 TaxID=1381751 RepID=UPI0004717816|nr:CrcB family protein [Brevibacterium sp. VCM10]